MTVDVLPSETGWSRGIISKSLMRETWDQELTKMAAKKRGCSKRELYLDFTVCTELQHYG